MIIKEHLMRVAAPSPESRLALLPAEQRLATENQLGVIGRMLQANAVWLLEQLRAGRTFPCRGCGGELHLQDGWPVCRCPGRRLEDVA